MNIFKFSAGSEEYKTKENLFTKPSTQLKWSRLKSFYQNISFFISYKEVTGSMNNLTEVIL